MFYYLLPLYIFIATLPSLIWLMYYLKNDPRPEPKSLIIKTFLWGAFFTTPLAAILEYLSLKLAINFFLVSEISLTLFFIWALIEEYFKYLAAKFAVLWKTETDEPIDIMIYLISAGLGFAAVENIFSVVGALKFSSLQGLEIAFFRFIGAVFLHALSSGILGYFLAKSWYYIKKIIFVFGLIFVGVLHALYNYFIILNNWKIISVYILIFMAVLLAFFFKNIKKQKSICKMDFKK